MPVLLRIAILSTLAGAGLSLFNNIFYALCFYAKIIDPMLSIILASSVGMFIGVAICIGNEELKRRAR